MSAEPAADGSTISGAQGAAETTRSGSWDRVRGYGRRVTETHIQPNRLADLRTRIRREIDEGLLPSCQVAVGLDGEIVFSETLGDASDDTRYCVFSCTKQFVAGVMWQLIGEGKLQPEDRVVDHWPEFGANGKDVVTIEHLLTHTAGFPLAPMRPEVALDPEARRAKIVSWRLNWEPGTRFEYHPTSAHWVLGELIERLDGIPVGKAVQRRIAEPLGLRFQLGVPPSDGGDIATLFDVGTFPTAEELEEAMGIEFFDVGEVTPEALLMFNTPEARAAGVPGGGGVGRAADLALYLQAMLHNPGELWDPEVLADGTGHVRNMLPDPILGYRAWRTLGIVVAGDDGQAFMRGFGHTVGPRAFGHNGAGGQIAWADPDSGLSFVYVTNGMDRHLLRESRRTSGIASRAGLLTTP